MSERKSVSRAKREPVEQVRTERVSMVEPTIAAPTTGAPPVPRGFVAPTGAEVQRFKKLTAEQTSEAKAVAAELRAARSYGDDFGKHAPDAGPLANELDLVAAWSQESAAARAWAEYAQAQAERVAHAAATSLAKLSEPFAVARDNDASVARRYPSLARMLSVRAEIATRSVATRRAKKKAAGKAAK